MNTKRIPVCLPDNKIVYCRGYVFHIWTVAPAYCSNGFSAAAWSVRHLTTGMSVAAFRDRGVAVNFALYLWRTYGDISQTLINSYNYIETPQDAKILDEINQRSNHITRIRKQDQLLHVPVPPLFRGVS